MTRLCFGLSTFENIARVSRLKLSAEENQLGGNSVSFVTADSGSDLTLISAVLDSFKFFPDLSVLSLRAKYLLNERIMVVPKTTPTKIPTRKDNVSAIFSFGR